MNSVPLVIGLCVVMAASFINHRVATNYNGSMNVWYGWVTATIVRFSAIIFTGIYFISRNQSELNAPGFMLTLLCVLLAGLVFDLFFSLSRVNRQQDRNTRKVG